jgi:RNA recognition motif-containing protein
MRQSSFQGNVHIINFPAGVTPGDLAALFDDFGLVMGAQIKSIPSTGGNLRLGIVSIAPDDAADRAIEALQGYRMGDQKLKLKRAVPPPKPDPAARSARPAPRPAPPSPRPYDAMQADPFAGPAERFSAAADRFPAAAEPAPRKVIVEYKKRRTISRI